MKSKPIQSATRFSLGVLSIGILAACGGAGGGGGLDVADGGIRGTGSSVGPVSGFGSVFVNGVKFSTDGIPNREVQSNDGIDTESDLSEGMIVRIEGQWGDNGQGTADELRYDDTLRGPVESVVPDPSGAGEFVTVTVMGQAVRVDRQTVVRGTTYADLLAGMGVGDYVRVSAWRQADGSYRAGYIGVISADLSDVELEGSVSSLDTSLDTFSIGAITVEYNASTVVFGSGLSEADLSEGDVLEVEGSLSGGTLTALSLNRADGRRFSRGSSDDIEFTATVDEPFASNGAATLPGEFTVGDLTVRVNASTELDDGLELADLVEGLLVQVEGHFVSEGVVEAEEIELREGNAKVKGVVSVTGSNDFVIGGVEVRVSSSTVFTVEDGSGVSLATLPIGDTVVEVEGIETQLGAEVFINALRVEVDAETEDPGDQNEFELEGQLRDISPFPGTISLLGIQLSDNSADYDNVLRGTIVTDFQSGQTVLLEVKYTKTGSGFSADEIELEETDND